MLGLLIAPLSEIKSYAVVLSFYIKMMKRITLQACILRYSFKKDIFSPPPPPPLDIGHAPGHLIILWVKILLIRWWMSKHLILSFYTIAALCAVAIYSPWKYFDQFFTGTNNTHYSVYKNITKFYVILYIKYFPRLA